MTKDQKKDHIDGASTLIANAIIEINTLADSLDNWRIDVENDKSIPPATLGYAYFQVRTLYDNLDKAVKRIYHFHDALNKHLIPTRLRDFDMDGMRIPEIAKSFGITQKVSASMLDKDKGLAWIREIGQGDMIQETVNAGTLAAFCRNLMLEQGIDPPADIIKVTTYDTTSMVNYRPKPNEL